MQLYLRPFYKVLDNKIILNGQQNTKNDLKKEKHLLLKKL